MNTEDKLKLIGLCRKLVSLGSMELADDLEEIIDKQVAKEKKKDKESLKYQLDACKFCEVLDQCKRTPLTEPLELPKCPHTITISVFAWRQCLSNRYLAHLGSY